MLHCHRFNTLVVQKSAELVHCSGDTRALHQAIRRNWFICYRAADARFKALLRGYARPSRSVVWKHHPASHKQTQRGRLLNFNQLKCAHSHEQEFVALAENSAAHWHASVNINYNLDLSLCRAGLPDNWKHSHSRVFHPQVLAWDHLLPDTCSSPFSIFCLTTKLDCNWAASVDSALTSGVL